jgi:hypothetical protein
MLTIKYFKVFKNSGIVVIHLTKKRQVIKGYQLGFSVVKFDALRWFVNYGLLGGRFLLFVLIRASSNGQQHLPSGQDIVILKIFFCFSMDSFKLTTAKNGT